MERKKYGKLVRTSATWPHMRHVAVGVLVVSGVMAAPVVGAAPPAPAMTPTLLASLPGGTGLETPAWTLTQGNDGNFYGTALHRNNSNTGGVFQVSPTGTYTDIEDFNPNQRMSPLGGLIQAANGLLYGTMVTTTDGSTSAGSVYSIAHDGEVTILHNFAPATSNGLLDDNSDGALPEANLVQTRDGTLYGVAYTGGLTGGGTIFSESAAGAFNLLYTFGTKDTAAAITNGTNPVGALVVGNDGNLYGTTRYGGANGVGTIFRMTPAGTLTALASFPAPQTAGYCGAASPPNSGALALGTDGKFYGTQCAGGANGTGMLFSFDPDGASITILHSFAAGFDVNAGGSAPNSSLALGADGNLYGTTSSGGANGNGTIFVLNPAGTFTTLYNFSASGSADGKFPWPLIIGGDNNLYGTALGGGANSSGTAFKLQHLPQNDLVLSSSATATLDVRLINQLGTRQVVQSVASGYYPIAVADFDGDGIPDILWTSANHDLYMWLGGKGSASGFKTHYVGTYPAGWSVTGAGDMDGDGKADLYWINPATHQFAYWLMNGPTRIGSGSTAYTPGYYPIAEGDFNGDGKLDVLWSSANNDLYVWYANGPSASHFFTTAYAGTFPSGWHIAGVGDLDGDGKTDLVWMKTDGTQWGYWLMNGVQRKATVALANTGVNGTAIAGVDEYGGDGLADLIWSSGSNLIQWTNAGTCATQCTFNPATLTAAAAGTTVFRKNVP